MRKKRVLLCMATLLAVSMLCGCTKINVNINKKSDTDANKQADSATDDQADLAQTLATFPELTCDEYDLSKYDGDTMYFESHGNEWYLTEESAQKYPNLVAPLKEIADNQKKDLENDLEQYDDEAKQYAKDNQDDENFYCYASDADTGLACADLKVVSLVTTQFASLGGAHPSTATMAYNLDVQTGQHIPLSAVINNKDGLNAMLKEKLIEEYTDHDFFGLDESLDDMDMGVAATEDDKPVYVYSFAPDGLTFYFDPADLSPYADGGEQVYLTFDQLTPILEDHFK